MATSKTADTGADTGGRKGAAAAADEQQVKARVLCAGLFGQVDDVVVVTAKQAREHRELDPHPDAVAYAEGLAAAKAAAAKAAAENA